MTQPQSCVGSTRVRDPFSHASGQIESATGHGKQWAVEGVLLRLSDDSWSGSKLRILIHPLNVAGLEICRGALPGANDWRTYFRLGHGGTGTAWTLAGVNVHLRLCVAWTEYCGRDVWGWCFRGRETMVYFHRPRGGRWEDCVPGGGGVSTCQPQYLPWFGRWCIQTFFYLHVITGRIPGGTDVRGRSMMKINTGW